MVPNRSPSTKASPLRQPNATGIESTCSPAIGKPTPFPLVQVDAVKVDGWAGAAQWLGSVVTMGTFCTYTRLAASTGTVAPSADPSWPLPLPGRPQAAGVVPEVAGSPATLVLSVQGDLTVIVPAAFSTMLVGPV